MSKTRLRTALHTLAEWYSIDGDSIQELYDQGVLEHGDMPDWEEGDEDDF